MLRRAAVRVDLEQAETARWRLLECSPAGFEEREGDGVVELAAYLDDDHALARMREAFAEISVTEVAEGWESEWRTFHRPCVAGGVWVGPPWEIPPRGLPTVVVDPGRAFGTGSHPTTRLCLELLAGVDRGSMLDVGCGSGVLAIAASRLGFEPVTGVDDDPVAVEVARANARRNGVRVSVEHADALARELPVVDVAVANVALHPVESILARAPARTIVTSGYLEDECPSHEGWSLTASRTLQGWAGHRFHRVSPPADAAA